MSSGETIEIELTDPQAAILASNEDRNLWMGGQGSGKTAGMGFLTYNFNAFVPDVMGLIAANTYSQLTNSTLKEILKTWALMGFTKYSESNPNGSYVIDRAPPKHFKPHKYIFRDNNGKLFTKNGGVMILASLDNYSALEGMELGWALLDETADTKEEAVREVITARLREKGLYKSEGGFPFSHDGTIPVNPLYVFTKPGRVDWINTYFGLDQMRDQITLKIFSQTDFFQNVTDNRFVVVSNAFLNKDNLPTNYLENRIKDLSPEDAERLIYGNPFSKTGTEYYSSFEIKTHVGKYGYLPNLPLHITFDFNVNPYMTLQVWQVKTGQRDEARCIKEYAMKSPKNTIERTCKAFLNDFSHLCVNGLYLYGDSSGASHQPTELKSYFSIVQNELRRYLRSNSLCLLKQNVRDRAVGYGKIGRREFMTALLRGRYEVDVRVDSGCVYTIADFENVMEDSNGTKSKKKVLVDGIACEKYGHMSDASDSFLAYRYGKYLRRKVTE